VQLRDLDAHGHSPIAGEKQELAPRCGFEEASLCFGETERTLHSGCFRGSMTAEENDRAIGRDHAALVGAEEVLCVLGRHHQ
jgi:hypothetical protein